MTPAHARPILWLAGRAALQIPCSACWADPTDLANRPARLFRGAIVLLQLVGFAKRIQDSRWGATKAKFLPTKGGVCLAAGEEGGCRIRSRRLLGRRQEQKGQLENGMLAGSRAVWQAGRQTGWLTACDRDHPFLPLLPETSSPTARRLFSILTRAQLARNSGIHPVARELTY